VRFNPFFIKSLVKTAPQPVENLDDF